MSSTKVLDFSTGLHCETSNFLKLFFPRTMGALNCQAKGSGSNRYVSLEFNCHDGNLRSFFFK